MCNSLCQRRPTSHTARTAGSLALSLTLGLLSALQTASAMDDFGTSQEVWRTDVSGYTTNSYKEFIAPDGFALTGMDARETSRLMGNESNDNPMFLSVGSSRLCTLNEAECTEPSALGQHTSATLRLAESNITSNKNVVLGARRYFTGIRVCTRNANRLDNRKIKGIEVFGGTIRNNGNVESNLRDSFTRPNCNNNWSAATQCRNGKYVKGIRAYYGSNGYVGIGVLCARATPPSSGQTLSGGSVQLKRQ